METLRTVISWMRSEWVYSSLLALPPATGLVGHSRGAVIAGLLAAEGNATAYVSLSGAWHDLGDPTQVTNITIPRLFIRGTSEGFDVDGFTWSQMSRPKHRALIDAMEHFDYLYSDVAPCRGGGHRCECTPFVAADLATMFFGEYLPPPAVPSLPGRIESSLIPPPPATSGLNAAAGVLRRFLLDRLPLCRVVRQPRELPHRALLGDVGRRRCRHASLTNHTCRGTTRLSFSRDFVLDNSGSLQHGATTRSDGNCHPVPAA
jgi:hypothetical protein